MDYSYIRYQVANNKALQLLRATNAPLIISFLFTQFKKQNRQVVISTELQNSLNDFLLQLNEDDGKEIYSEEAKTYLDNWAKQGFLRKFYPPSGDEPLYELTPATERALDWLKDLEKREFVGTQSRLLIIINLMKELIVKSSEDPNKKLEELKKQKSEIETEIQKVESGIHEKLSDTQIKDYYYNLYDSTRKLLSDFKQIEYNFRELDTDAREKQIASAIKKGKLLEDIFKQQDLIWDTDQGRSFRSFFEFIMSSQKQDELDELIKQLFSIPTIFEITNDHLVERLKENLINAGDKVNKTTHSLIAQLRKYLDDKSFQENRRILELINEVKAIAISLKENPPITNGFIEVEDKPDIDFIMDRPLFTPSENMGIAVTIFEIGSSTSISDVLYNQVYVDQELLRKHIRELLKTHSEVSLKQVIEKFPVEKGIAEIVAYLDLASKSTKVKYCYEIIDIISIANLEKEQMFEIKLPQVIFS